MANFKLSSTNVLDKNNYIQNFPIGTVVPFLGTTIPSGWLLCDGTQYSTTGTYKDLYNVIGTTYGSGPGTFAVPQMNNLYPSSSNSDNVTNYPTTHTHSGNIAFDATATTHSITHNHTGGSVGINAASASHNHNTSATNVNGGITPGSNANSVANRAVNSGPAANSPQAGWVGHTHNAGSGTINVGNDPYNHNHNNMNIGIGVNTTAPAVAHTISSISFTNGSSTYSPLGVKTYFIIKY